MGHRLGISGRAVDAQRATRRLLGLKVGSRWVYPGIQFQGSAILPGIPPVLDKMRDHDPWSILDEILARDEAWGHRSLVDILREGDTQAFDSWAQQISGDGFG